MLSLGLKGIFTGVWFVSQGMKCCPGSFQDGRTAQFPVTCCPVAAAAGGPLSIALVLYKFLLCTVPAAVHSLLLPLSSCSLAVYPVWRTTAIWLILESRSPRPSCRNRKHRSTLKTGTKVGHPREQSLLPGQLFMHRGIGKRW